MYKALTTPDRLDNLIVMLAIASAWVHLIGEWVYEQRSLKTKKHSYAPVSFFTRGLSYLRTAILATDDKPAKIPLASCLHLSSP